MTARGGAGKCDCRWTDSRYHCTKCHEGFTTEQNFDLHRTGPVGNRQCAPPAKAGLEARQRNSGPVWAQPGETDGPPRRNG